MPFHDLGADSPEVVETALDVLASDICVHLPGDRSALIGQSFATFLCVQTIKLCSFVQLKHIGALVRSKILKFISIFGGDVKSFQEIIKPKLLILHEVEVILVGWTSGPVPVVATVMSIVAHSLTALVK